MNVQAIIFYQIWCNIVDGSSFRFTFFMFEEAHLQVSSNHISARLRFISWSRLGKDKDKDMSPGLCLYAGWAKTKTKTNTKTKTCLRVYLLKQGGQTVKLTNAPIRWQRFRISPHIFSSIYFCSCHHFATFQIAFRVKPELKKLTSSFLLLDLSFDALEAYSTNINWGLNLNI